MLLCSYVNALIVGSQKFLYFAFKPVTTTGMLMVGNKVTLCLVKLAYLMRSRKETKDTKDTEEFQNTLGQKDVSLKQETFR